MDSSYNGSSAKKLGGARVSLLTKGIVAFVVPLLYIILIGFVLSQKFHSLRTIIDQQRTLYKVEESLGRVNSTLAYAILNVSHAYSNPQSKATEETVTLDLEAVQAGLEALKEHYALIQPWISKLNSSVVLIKSNWSQRNLFDLRESLHELVSQLVVVTGEISNRQQALSENFHRAYNSIIYTSLLLGLIGAVIFGGVVMLFFSRLVRDIRELQARAMNMVKGHRGEPIAITRHDELGELMQSVNNMQSVLREREAQLEVARQRRFHHEKMAAVGSLAAAIAHEVNNPIAAITGIAEEIRDTQHYSACPQRVCRPELILEQTRRISDITRQLAEMTAPHSPEPQPVDINALIRSTCGFIRYDKRFSGIEFNLDLDPQVPAINTVADYLTQILMNLLINAADATDGIVDRKPFITVQSGFRDGQIVLEVTDNGCGMDEVTLARAFDDSFTTKPPGKGRGLGLFMCSSLIKAEGGQIELDSELGRGTRASVYLPRLAQG